MTELPDTPSLVPPQNPDAVLRPPSAAGGLLDVFRRRYLLQLLVRREISARYQGSFLGLMWSYVNPLSQFVIYWLLMSVLLQLHRDVENFAIHMFAGMVIVHFFIETFNAGTRSIVRNKAIVRKMAVPREMFPVASMLVSLYHVGPALVILVVACLFYGWTPDPGGVLALVLSLLIIMTLGTALALVFSAANVFFNDFGNAVNILTHLVRFGVPMMYPYSLVSQRFGGMAQYYLMNPIADAVLLLQRAFWVGTTSRPKLMAAQELPAHLYLYGLAALAVSVVALAVAQLSFSRMENRIPERI